MIFSLSATDQKLKPWLIRLKSWEYWPTYVIYFPLGIYFLWLSLRSKSMLFFTATNPAIENGGLFGDSKLEIMELIPSHLRPTTIEVNETDNLETILEKLSVAKIEFPVVIKPNIGERGFLVEKINSVEVLKDYLGKYPIQMIIQEYIDYEEEVSVLYYRYPGESNGFITSLTLKDFLAVTGDGNSTVEELIKSNPRAVLQLDKLKADEPALLEQVPLNGERIQLVSIGNHSRGTTFLNGNHLIDQQLHLTFDKISQQMPGIFFGRFDIKCKSLDDLKAGKNFSILEINGTKAEPTHIYQPGFSLLTAIKVILDHWKVIYQISALNHEKGVPFLSFSTGLKRYLAYRNYKKAYK